MATLMNPTLTDGAPRDQTGGLGRSVRLAGLGKTYENGTQALAGVDLTAEKGEFVVLLGPSGCGKTTLLRCIAGLERANSGRILIGGEDVTFHEPGNRGLAMVFQNYALYPGKTVLENIEYPLRMAKVPRPERQRRTREMADLLRLGSLLDRHPAQLSGGQRQRVGIGRALVREPSVLLMDEPLSNLDAELRGELRLEIQRLQRRTGTTTFYVTHDQAEALALADRLILMRDGQIEQNDRPEVAYQRPATRFAASFLGGMSILAVQPNRTGAARLAVLPAAVQAEVDAGRVAEIGVRAEDLRLIDADDEQLAGELLLRGPVEAQELLGRERLVHFRCLGDQRIRVRVHADRPVPAEVSVVAKASDIHLFDGDGRRVAAALPTSNTVHSPEESRC